MELTQTRILIIDDDALDREVYKRYLRDASNRSFSFSEESTGRAGLARLKDSPPDCVLLDFNLPDMNGLEVLEALKNGSSTCPVPIVMLTAARDEQVAVDAMKNGVMDYLPKGPKTAESLDYAIQNAIEKFRMHAEIARQQLELETSEKRYRGLVEAIPQMVWTAAPDGTFDFVNAKWFDYVGIGLHEFNQRGWASILHADDLEQFNKVWEKGISSEEPFELEHRIPRREGSTVCWFLSRAVPMHDEHGSLIKWFGTSTDIEDRKKAETAVLSKQKLESLGLLAGGIAHDFNNLLVGILGGASYAAEILPAAHPLQLTLHGIVSAGERAAHLTRQMLAYAGKGRFFIEQVDMGELVRSTCDLIKASIPKHVQLTLNIRPHLPMVAADSGQMQQIVMNLILNAAESTDSSRTGSVVITTDMVVADRADIEPIDFVSGGLEPGTFVVLEVKDNGSGMDAETMAKIFDPFFTTKFTGRGLGLSAVQGILRTHNGVLELESKVGQGSTFRVFLPASPKAKVEVAAPIAQPSKVTGTVLIVDDEDIVRRTAKMSLERAGLHVITTHSGAKAIHLLLSNDTQPISLVVLDMGMPGTSGKDVMQQIRSLGIQVPVLICSGYSEAEVYQEFSGLDVAGFVQKPFTARQIALKVSAILPARETNL